MVESYDQRQFFCILLCIDAPHGSSNYTSLGSGAHMNSTPRKVDNQSHSSVAGCLWSPSIITRLSATSVRSTSMDASNNTTYTPTTMEVLLKMQKERFVIIGNINRDLSNNCYIYNVHFSKSFTWY